MEDALKNLEGQDQDVHLDLDKPVEESISEASIADAPAVSAEVAPAVEAAAPAPEARPELNCVPCAGSGLKDEQTLCPQCGGKGYVA